MKRKNSDSRVHRWLLRTGMAFLLILALVSVVLLSFNLGMLHHGSVNSGPSGAVLDDNSPFVHAPAHTVLRQVQRADLAGTLFLAGWIEPKGTKCLGAMRVKQNHRLDNGHGFHGSITECDLDRYSIDQFWTGKLWDREPYSFAYGYSGDAESVVVTWQDNTVTQDTPVKQHVYCDSRGEMAGDSIDRLYDVDGALIYRLPDARRRGTVSRQNGS